MKNIFKVSIAAAAVSLIGLAVYAQNDGQSFLVGHGPGGLFEVQLSGPVNLTSGVLTVTGLPRFSALTAETLSFTAVAGNSYTQAKSSATTTTLPTAVGVEGSEVYVKNIGTSTVTMASTSSQTINGGAAGSTTIATTNAATFLSDGANWITE